VPKGFLEGIALGLVAIVLVVGLAIAHAHTPCGAYKFTSVKNVPARCLAHFERR
jgi:hypothetical protein